MIVCMPICVGGRVAVKFLYRHGFRCLGQEAGGWGFAWVVVHISRDGEGTTRKREKERESRAGSVAEISSGDRKKCTSTVVD